MRSKPYVLCILDGWGEAPPSPSNAISLANTPTWDLYKKNYPFTTLDASGATVGLPEGQMGNSEVGHMAIGAGRTLFQDLPRIDQAIQSRELSTNPTLLTLISSLKQTKGACHLMGLLSPGGVHSHLTHIVALATILSQNHIPVVVHGFLDGRDTPPQSALTYIQNFENQIAPLSGVSIGTIGGRYYAMDRDNRWERIEKAYAAIVSADGPQVISPEKAIEISYAKGITDEFVIPVVCTGYKGIQSGDAILMANFRADRVRQLLTGLVNPAFKEFSTIPLGLSASVGMTSYSTELDAYLPALFPPQTVSNSLGEIVSNHGLKQLRIAETEKYAHVTFFLNGGREEPFPGEDRLLIPSPKVATYDLKPEMAAEEMTNRLVDAIMAGIYDFIVVNYANPDMVGHTGNLSASIQAVEVIDKCLGRIEDAVKEREGVLFITADHGNVEELVDKTSHHPHTAHTCNPVPFIVVGRNLTFQKLHLGKLTDIAPSVLYLMGLKAPDDMTGRPLFDSQINKEHTHG